VTAGELSPYSSDEADSVTDVQGNTVSVERVINAPATQIFALIADAGKHSSIDGSGTVDHSPEQSQPLSLGSKFGMSMRGRPETLFIRTAPRTSSSNSSQTAASRGRPGWAPSA
jgi:hypothetical protein